MSLEVNYKNNKILTPWTQRSKVAYIVFMSFWCIDARYDMAFTVLLYSGWTPAAVLRSCLVSACDIFGSSFVFCSSDRGILRSQKLTVLHDDSPYTWIYPSLICSYDLWDRISVSLLLCERIRMSGTLWLCECPDTFEYPCDSPLYPSDDVSSRICIRWADSMICEWCIYNSYSPHVFMNTFCCIIWSYGCKFH